MSHVQLYAWLVDVVVSATNWAVDGPVVDAAVEGDAAVEDAAVEGDAAVEDAAVDRQHCAAEQAELPQESVESGVTSVVNGGHT